MYPASCLHALLTYSARHRSVTDAHPINFPSICFWSVLQDLAEAIRSSRPLFKQALQSDESKAAEDSSEAGGQCGWEGAKTAGDEGDKEAACGGSDEEDEGEQGEVPVLVSGAGHDAMAMADATKVCACVCAIDKEIVTLSGAGHNAMAMADATKVRVC